MLRIEVPDTEAEVAADGLWAAGASAVGEEPGDGTVVLTADLDRCPPALASWPHETAVDDGTWWDGWRPFGRAVTTGPFVVRPPWIDTDGPEGAVELVIDPGRSFGTGAHPSTTLALRALVRVLRPGDSVLDAGCGSGALAVGAARLGASSVVAVDTDPEAVRATTANAARNGVSALVQVAGTGVEATTGAFDVVAANLGAPLVFDLAGVLSARVAVGGSLVLSGMLGDLGDRVRAAYPDATVLEASEDDGWTCVILRLAEQEDAPPVANSFGMAPENEPPGRH